MTGFHVAACLVLSQAYTFEVLLRGIGATWLPWPREQIATVTTTTATTDQGGHSQNAYEWGFFRWGVSPPGQIPPSASVDTISREHSLSDQSSDWFYLVFQVVASIQAYACQGVKLIECTVSGTSGQVSLILRWGYWALVFAAFWISLLIIWHLAAFLVIPFFIIVKEIYWFMCGDNTWAEVKAARGIPVNRVSWVGPDHRQQWDAQYITQKVRGRGAVDRKPFDLLLSAGRDVARIRQETSKADPRAMASLWKIAQPRCSHARQENSERNWKHMNVAFTSVPPIRALPPGQTILYTSTRLQPFHAGWFLTARTLPGPGPGAGA